MSTRYPPIRLFERVADPSEWEAVAAAEMLTNPRVRDALGELSLVPNDDRVSGPGASWVMASFTHPRASRFTPGNFGVYYAGAALETAVREYAHHLGRAFLSARQPLGAHAEIRCVVGRVDNPFVDIRGGFAELHDPDSYVASQAFATNVRAAGSHGIVYDSVRHPGGECIATFRPKAVERPVQGPHIRLHFDGERFDRWFNHTTDSWRSL